ncbi:hypothetical protein V5F29_09700 [Xanthobacter aminoxidans]
MPARACCSAAELRRAHGSIKLSDIKTLIGLATKSASLCRIGQGKPY